MIGDFFLGNQKNALEGRIVGMMNTDVNNNGKEATASIP
jgi:hypothetical protein